MIEPLFSRKRECSINNLLILGAYPQSLTNFRGDLIRDLVQAGWQVTAMTAPADDGVIQELVDKTGATFAPFQVARNSLNPLADLKTLASLRAAFRQQQPQVILAYTIKPVIWGAIAARKVPQARFVALITGLGYAFQAHNFKRRLLRAAVIRLYRFALRRAQAVIFQNTDNRDLFLKYQIVPPEKCHVVNGSGINLDTFPATPLPSPDQPTRFLMIARLLGEKGLREYVAAARQLQPLYPSAEFHLVGPPDPSPDGVPLAEVQAWHEAGWIRYHGETRDVRPWLQQCHVYVLPSYHEGMPRTVLEALATGRPILTTDVSGCKETVVSGENGWLVPHADAPALAERMAWFIEHPHCWPAMATASRALAEQKFDVRRVNEAMLSIVLGRG